MTNPKHPGSLTYNRHGKDMPDPPDTPPGFVRFSVWIHGSYGFEIWRQHFLERGVPTIVLSQQGFFALYRRKP